MPHIKTDFHPVTELDESRFRLTMLADLLSAANPDHLDISEFGLCGLTSVLRDSVASEGRVVDHINERNALGRAA